MIKGREGVEYFWRGHSRNARNFEIWLRSRLSTRPKRGCDPKNRFHSSLSSASSTSRSNGFQQQEQRKFSG
jgi:hypothetical protein